MLSTSAAANLATSVIFVVQSFRDNLQELLSILLVSADPCLERLLHNSDKTLGGNGLFVDRPLVQRIQHLLQPRCDHALLQPEQLPIRYRLAILVLLLLHSRLDVLVKRRAVQFPAVQFADQVHAQFRKTGQRLKHRVNEAVVRRIAQAYDPLLPCAPRRVRSLIVEEVSRAENVDEGGGCERCACCVGSDRERFLLHPRGNWPRYARKKSRFS